VAQCSAHSTGSLVLNTLHILSTLYIIRI
jgi:hypothetical protein